MQIETVIASGLTAAAATIASWLGFKSKQAEGPHTAFLEELQSEVSRLREDLTERDKQANADHDTILRLQAQVRGLASGVYVLTAQMREHGIEPRWTPPPII